MHGPHESCRQQEIDAHDDVDAMYALADRLCIYILIVAHSVECEFARTRECANESVCGNDDAKNKYEFGM